MPAPMELTRTTIGTNTLVSICVVVALCNLEMNIKTMPQQRSAIGAAFSQLSPLFHIIDVYCAPKS